MEGVSGIVTGVSAYGFWFQDPEPDEDERTSEALFVFTGAYPHVQIGDAVQVSGRVTEYRPGCNGCDASNSAYANLTLTELEKPTKIVVTAREQSLPEPVLIGTGGRLPPLSVFENDATSDVEEEGVLFDPREDGLDFFESLEGMLVTLDHPVCVAPSREGEVTVIPQLAGGAVARSSRGGVIVSPGQFHPERLAIKSEGLSALDVGAQFLGPVTGVLDYRYGSFSLTVTEPLPRVHATVLTREELALPPATADELTIASFNLENLHPGSGGRYSSIAELVVKHMHAPDLIAVQEVQDDSGNSDDGVVQADETLERLNDAIQQAGGPAYRYTDIDPVDGADGGQPGANIRTACLFREDRGLSLVHSPAQLAPAAPAFAGSRKPLVANFAFNGSSLMVVLVHFKSKAGDQPLFGRFQPPLRSSDAQRTAQASAVARFASGVLARDARARLIVLGDFNDFGFSEPMNELKQSRLHSLLETLPANDRYTYIYRGNSQGLDDILVSPELLRTVVGIDVVHANSEFAEQVSDHDPVVARLRLSPASAAP